MANTPQLLQSVSSLCSSVGSAASLPGSNAGNGSNSPNQAGYGLLHPWNPPDLGMALGWLRNVAERNRARMQRVEEDVGRLHTEMDEVQRGVQELTSQLNGRFQSAGSGIACQDSKHVKSETSLPRSDEGLAEAVTTVGESLEALLISDRERELRIEALERKEGHEVTSLQTRVEGLEAAQVHLHGICSGTCKGMAELTVRLQALEKTLASDISSALSAINGQITSLSLDLAKSEQSTTKPSLGTLSGPVAKLGTMLQDSEDQSTPGESSRSTTAAATRSESTAPDVKERSVSQVSSQEQMHEFENGSAELARLLVKIETIALGLKKPVTHSRGSDKPGLVSSMHPFSEDLEKLLTQLSTGLREQIRNPSVSDTGVTSNGHTPAECCETSVTASPGRVERVPSGVDSLASTAVNGATLDTNVVKLEECQTQINERTHAAMDAGALERQDTSESRDHSPRIVPRIQAAPALTAQGQWIGGLGRRHTLQPLGRSQSDLNKPVNHDPRSIPPNAAPSGGSAAVSGGSRLTSLQASPWATRSPSARGSPPPMAAVASAAALASSAASAPAAATSISTSATSTGTQMARVLQPSPLASSWALSAAGSRRGSLMVAAGHSAEGAPCSSRCNSLVAAAPSAEGATSHVSPSMDQPVSAKTMPSQMKWSPTTPGRQLVPSPDRAGGHHSPRKMTTGLRQNSPQTVRH